MHAPRLPRPGPDLPSFAVYLHTDMHSAHQHNCFINSNITFSWPVVGCVLHQPTSDVRSHVYPDEGPLYVCVHYYALPLHVMHGTYTLCISPTITTCHFVIVGNKKLASGGQFGPA